MHIIGLIVFNYRTQIKPIIAFDPVHFTKQCIIPPWLLSLMRYGSTTPTGTNPIRSGMNMGKGFRELRSSGQTGYLYFT